MSKLREISKLPRRMAWAMVMEGVETTRMMKIFARFGTSKLRLTAAHRNPTPEEMQEAIEQLKDIPRFLPFFVVIVLPVPGMAEGYAVVALTLERWMGDRMRLLPSQFRHLLKRDEDSTSKPVQKESKAKALKH